MRVGFFSFTCDEGCGIVFTEILNRKYFDWASSMELVVCRLLQERADLNDIDVAFVEGAIATYSEKEAIKRIRTNSRRLVAIGSCAISGAPSDKRNYFDKATLAEIKPVLERHGHMPHVYSVKDIVPVDAEVPGCPMDEQKFIEVMEKYLKEFEKRAPKRGH